MTFGEEYRAYSSFTDTSSLFGTLEEPQTKFRSQCERPSCHTHARQKATLLLCIF